MFNFKGKELNHKRFHVEWQTCDVRNLAEITPMKNASYARTIKHAKAQIMHRKYLIVAPLYISIWKKYQ